MRLQGIFIHLRHAYEQLQGFIGLPIQDQIQAAKVVGTDGYRGGVAALGVVEPGVSPTGGRDDDEHPGEQKGGFSRHVEHYPASCTSRSGFDHNEKSNPESRKGMANSRQRRPGEYRGSQRLPGRLPAFSGSSGGATPVTRQGLAPRRRMPRRGRSRIIPYDSRSLR